MKKDQQIITEFKKRKVITEQRMGAQWNNTRKCQAFYAGDFMTYEDKIQFNTSNGKKRATVRINTVKPYVNAVNGFLIQTRSNADYSAKIEDEIEQQLYSEYANSIKDYLRENGNADQTDSQGNKDVLIAGYGAQETAMSYGDGYATAEPGGSVIFGRLDPLTVGWDPFAQAMNVMDKRWIYYGKEFDIKDALVLFDDAKKEDFEGIDGPEGGDYKFLPNGGVYDRQRIGAEFTDPKGDMVKVYFYQWYDVEEYYEALNPIHNLQSEIAIQAAMFKLEAVAAEADDEGDADFDPRATKLVFSNALKARLVEEFDDLIDPIKFNRKVFYGAVLSGNKVFSKYRLPTQQDFTIQIKTGDRDDKNKIWVGMVNSMMEPVMYYNKALTELMFIIGANSKGGVMIEEDAVEDIEEFEEQYPKTDSVVVVNPGALSGGKIQTKKEPQSVTGYENVVTLMDSAMVQVNGIDKTFLGSSENRLETAALQRKRIKQITALLAQYVDSILLSQKMGSRILLDFMRIWSQNNEGALFPILGKNGMTQYLRVSQDKLMAEYGITINDAPPTDEEEDQYLQTLITMGDKISATGNTALGNKIYGVAVKYMKLKPEDKLMLQQELSGSEQPIDPAYVQQLEGMVQELQSAQSQATIENIASSTAFNIAKADEARKNAKVKEATTLKTLAEADRTEIETDLAQRAPISAENVSVSL